jgi:LysM repeat protein
MSELRGPVRHGSRARRPPRPPSVQQLLDGVQPESADLQAVFTALARRAKLPTGPDARPAEVLRAAGIPLLMAAIVAGGQPVAGSHPVANLDGGGAAPAGAAQPVAGGWTVTTPQVQGTAPQPSAPKPAAPRAAPQNPATAAKSAAPRSTAPRSAAPKSAAPKPSVRKSAAPKPSAPKPSAPEQSAPQQAAPRQAQPERPAPKALAGYLVRPGDTLIGIAQQHRVKLHDILELNHLHLESIIRPGDRLRLPNPPPPDPASALAGRTFPAAVVAAANANRAALAQARVPSREQVQAMVVSTARSMGVPPALALGIAYLESGFHQRVVSPANAVGVMQVVPSTGRWASQVVGRPLDVMNAKDNITVGVALLRALLNSANTQAQAIAGYYQGLSSVQRSGMFDDTRRFVANVQTLEARFAGGA